MRPNRLLIVFLLLLVAGIFAQAATSPFNYQSYKRLALKELYLEKQFLADLDRTQNIQIINHVNVERDVKDSFAGISVLVACLETASSDAQIKSVMDQFVIVYDAGADVEYNPEYQLPCAGKNTNNLRDVLHSQVAGALIGLYRAKAPPSRSLYEERVSNAILASANGFDDPDVFNPDVSIFEFSHLSSRFGSDKDLVPYVLETQLSDDDRIGIRLLAACVKQNAPLGSVASFAVRGELPGAEFLENLPCLKAAGFDKKTFTPKDLEQNFIRLANAVMGRNVFLHRNYNVIPSIVKDTMFFTADAQFIPVDTSSRDQAVAEILAIDDFVNVHVRAIRASMSHYPTYKGTYKLDPVNKLILTDVLLQKWKLRHVNAIREDAKAKLTLQMAESIADGVTSCATGAVTGEVIGFGVGYVLTASQSIPYVRAATFTLGAAFIAYSVKDAGDQVVELYKNYKDIPKRSDLVSKLCDTATNVWGFGHGLKFKESFAKARAKGTAIDGEVPVHAAPEIPKTFVSASVPVQPQTRGQVLANYISTMVQQDVKNLAAAKQYALQVKNWVKSKVKKPVAGQPDVPKPPLDGLQQVVSESPQVAQAALAIRVDEIKNDPVRTELKKNSESPDPKTAAEARTKLKADDRELIAELLEENGLNERILVSETPSGRQYTYWPERPGTLKVPKDVSNRFSKFLESAKAAGVDVNAKPHPDGVLLSSGSDVLDQFGKDLKKNWNCKKARLVGSRTLSFDTVILCPREDALFDQFRRMLRPDPVIGGGALLQHRTLASQLVGVSEFRRSLPLEKLQVFDEVYGLLKNPHTFEDVPGGVQKVLELRRQKAGTDPEWEDFALKVTLAMDSGLDSSVDVFGRHAKLLQSAASTKPVQAKKLRDKKDDRGAQELERDYTADVISAMIDSRDTAHGMYPGEPILSEKGLASVFERYGNANEPDIALFKDFNSAWTKHLDSTVLGLSGSSGKLTLLNQVERISSDRLASGESRVAYLVQVRLKGRAEPVKFVVKVGPLTADEVALYGAWSQKGFATRVFGQVDGKERSVLFQEFVDGKTIREITDKDSVVESAAELWASQAAATYQSGPNGGSVTFIRDFYVNYRHKKDGGQGVLFDIEPKQTSRPELKQFLFFMLAYSDMHFNEAQLSKFLRQFISRFSQKNTGVSQAEIHLLLKELRSEIKDNYLGLAFKLQPENGPLTGEFAFIKHALLDPINGGGNPNLPIAQRLKGVIDDIEGKPKDSDSTAPGTPSGQKPPAETKPESPKPVDSTPAYAQLGDTDLPGAFLRDSDGHIVDRFTRAFLTQDSALRSKLPSGKDSAHLIMTSSGKILVWDSSAAEGKRLVGQVNFNQDAPTIGPITDYSLSSADLTRQVGLAVDVAEDTDFRKYDFFQRGLETAPTVAHAGQLRPKPLDLRELPGDDYSLMAFGNHVEYIDKSGVVRKAFTVFDSHEEVVKSALRVSQSNRHVKHLRNVVDAAKDKTHLSYAQVLEGTGDSALTKSVCGAGACMRYKSGNGAGVAAYRTKQELDRLGPIGTFRDSVSNVLAGHEMVHFYYENVADPVKVKDFENVVLLSLKEGDAIMKNRASGEFVTFPDADQGDLYGSILEMLESPGYSNLKSVNNGVVTYEYHRIAHEIVAYSFENEAGFSSTFFKGYKNPLIQKHLKELGLDPDAPAK